MNSTQTFPVYNQPSGWNALLPKRTPSTDMPAERSYDVIVIGAGYTGLATARRIAVERPDKQVLVIEASTVGEGSAGRNSGFVISLPHNVKIGCDPQSQDLARRQIGLYRTGLGWLKDLVDSNGIDCGWNPAGDYFAAVTASGEADLRGSLEKYRNWGIEYTEFDREALNVELGTTYYRYGYHSFNSTFVQPAALIRGLAETLPSNVVLLERTAVLSLSENSPFRIKTARGEFTAQKIVVANNSFAKSLGLLKDRLFSIFTYAAMTPKLSDTELLKLGRPGEWGVLPGKRIGSTVRKTADGRLLVRCVQTYEHEASDDKFRGLLAESYKRRYPNMNSHEFEHYWSGVVGLTRNGANFFGELKPNLFVSVGCNGVGILKGSMFGRLIGELSMGIDSDALQEAMSLERPTWLPPEPIRRMSVMSAIHYHAAISGAER